jgi:hypothetical protein
MLRKVSQFRTAISSTSIIQITNCIQGAAGLKQSTRKATIVLHQRPLCLNALRNLPIQGFKNGIGLAVPHLPLCVGLSKIVCPDDIECSFLLLRHHIKDLISLTWCETWEHIMHVVCHDSTESWGPCHIVRHAKRAHYIMPYHWEPIRDRPRLRSWPPQPPVLHIQITLWGRCGKCCGPRKSCCRRCRRFLDTRICSDRRCQLAISSSCIASTGLYEDCCPCRSHLLCSARLGICESCRSCRSRCLWRRLCSARFGICESCLHCRCHLFG